MRWVGPVAAVLAAAVAGCTPVPPERIAGDPAPVTVAPTDSVTSAPTRPPGSPTPAGVPQLPTGYQGFALTIHGVTAWLPVPPGWSARHPLMCGSCDELSGAATGQRDVHRTLLPNGCAPSAPATGVPADRPAAALMPPGGPFPTTQLAARSDVGRSPKVVGSVGRVRTGSPSTGHRCDNPSRQVLRTRRRRPRCADRPNLLQRDARGRQVPGLSWGRRPGGSVSDR